MTSETTDEKAHHRDPLRFHRAHQTDGIFGDSFMERMSEKVASGMGTVQFIVISTVIILGWVFINHAVTFLEHAWKGLKDGQGFDPEPWILLNLIFSMVAFYTGALVIIAQKSQAKKDAAKEVADAQHREELAEIHSRMIQENTDLTKKVVDLTDQVERLAKEIHGAVCGAPNTLPPSVRKPDEP
jgi:uncharacterized membrane protein